MGRLDILTFAPVLAYLDDRGAGYAQRNFSILCPKKSCRFQITKDRLAAFKFAKNLMNGAPLAYADTDLLVLIHALNQKRQSDFGIAD
jgi:hypothetical protein